MSRRLFRTARLIAAKDLRIERRSRVAIVQITAFAMVVLFLFAFALDADRKTLDATTPGLYWVAMLLSLLLAVGRSFASETDDRALDSIRLAALDPAGVFLGKAAALAAQLVALATLLVVGIVLFYEADVSDVVLLVTSALVACGALAAAGTMYGALSAGVKARETLLPLLVLPAVAPVLIGATRAFEAAMGNEQSTSAADGWPWVGLLAAIAALYVAIGLVAFGPLLEDS